MHAPTLHVLLVSSRPATSPFFEGLARRHGPAAAWPFAVTQLPADAAALARHAGEVEGATMALVDVYPTPAAALRVCHALRARRPDLPVLALLCCSRTACPDELRALRGAGAGLSGAHATPEQLLADIESVARGEDVLDVRPAPQRRGAPDLLGARSPETAPVPAPRLTAAEGRLAELVAQGLTDEQIGARLGQSPRTVQRHVAELSAAVGARGRAHLAAWATAAGLYRFVPVPTDPALPDAGGDADERRRG